MGARIPLVPRVVVGLVLAFVIYEMVEWSLTQITVTEVTEWSLTQICDSEPLNRQFERF